nr:uncharacterized protein At5g39570-like [Malus domestica]
MLSKEPEAESSEVETLWFSSTSNPTEDSPAILHGNFNSNSFSITTALYGTGTEYGSGYGRKPEYKAPEPEYGYGYGRKPEYEASESEYGSGYGRKPEFEAPPAEFGSGNATEKPSYGEEGGYGEEPPRRPSYGRPSYETPESEERPGYDEEPPRRTGYGDELPPPRPSYGRAGYEGQESGEYEKPSYGRSEEQKYRCPGGYERRGDDDSDFERPKYGEEGYGRKKYVRTFNAGIMIEERDK